MVAWGRTLFNNMVIAELVNKIRCLFVELRKFLPRFWPLTEPVECFTHCQALSIEVSFDTLWLSAPR